MWVAGRRNGQGQTVDKTRSEKPALGEGPLSPLTRFGSDLTNTIRARGHTAPHREAGHTTVLGHTATNSVLNPACPPGGVQIHLLTPPRCGFRSTPITDASACRSGVERLLAERCLGSRDARVSHETDLPVAVRADLRRAQKGHSPPTCARARTETAEGHRLHLRAARRGCGTGHWKGNLVLASWNAPTSLLLLTRNRALPRRSSNAVADARQSSVCCAGRSPAPARRSVKPNAASMRSYRTLI